MKRKMYLKKGLAFVLALVLMMAFASGCGKKKTEGTEDKKQEEQAGQAVTSEAVDTEADAAVTAQGAEQDPPATGSMAETETDALGNPINDDGVYYDEDGNLVTEEDMMNVDEDGNPITEEDQMYSESGGDGWESVEYGEKEDFKANVKSGYEEVTEPCFTPTGTLYLLYANGVYEIQYESDTDLITFAKGKTEDQVNRVTVAYDKEETVKINDVDVRIQSYENVVYLALWSKGDYVYSIYCDQGCTKDEMVKMVSSVKNG